MNKTWLIIQREYWTRVKKRAFLLLTFLSPLLFASLIIAPVLINKATTTQHTVYVIDHSGKFYEQLPESGSIHYIYMSTDPPQEEIIQEVIKQNPSAFILTIPDFELNDPRGFRIISEKSPSIALNRTINSALEKRIKGLKIKQSGISKELLSSLEVDINLQNIILSEEGAKKGSTAAASIVSFIGGFLIYFFIFMYGGQVTTGVHEEKSSRIVEILISSVKPFQLMLGKIIGIALVGLTQFVLWIFLTLFITVIITLVAGPELMSANPPIPPAGGALPQANIDQAAMATQIKEAITTLNIPVLLGAFVFYFLGGYLLYSSLFAGIAAAVDSQSDMRQFIFPLSIPLIFSIVVIQTVLNNPDSGLAVWLSIIPLTSPVVMMARIPFGVPPAEMGASILCMIIGFIFAVWAAGKIYRTGILLYGKKVNFKELIKWVTYRG